MARKITDYQKILRKAAAGGGAPIEIERTLEKQLESVGPESEAAVALEEALKIFRSWITRQARSTGSHIPYSPGQFEPGIVPSQGPPPPQYREGGMTMA